MKLQKYKLTWPLTDTLRGGSSPMARDSQISQIIRSIFQEMFPENKDIDSYDIMWFADNQQNRQLFQSMNETTPDRCDINLTGTDDEVQSKPYVCFRTEYKESAEVLYRLKAVLRDHITTLYMNQIITPEDLKEVEEALYVNLSRSLDLLEKKLGELFPKLRESLQIKLSIKGGGLIRTTIESISDTLQKRYDVNMNQMTLKQFGQVGKISDLDYDVTIVMDRELVDDMYMTVFYFSRMVLKAVLAYMINQPDGIFAKLSRGCLERCGMIGMEQELFDFTLRDGKAIQVSANGTYTSTDVSGDMERYLQQYCISKNKNGCQIISFYICGNEFQTGTDQPPIRKTPPSPHVVIHTTTNGLRYVITTNSLFGFDKKEATNPFYLTDIDQITLHAKTYQTKFALVRGKILAYITVQFSDGEVENIKFPIDFLDFSTQTYDDHDKTSKPKNAIFHKKIQVNLGGTYDMWLYNVDYLIVDLEKILFCFDSVLPWLDKKYAKRIYRYITLLFIKSIQNSELSVFLKELDKTRQILRLVADILNRASQTTQAQNIMAVWTELREAFGSQIIFNKRCHESVITHQMRYFGTIVSNLFISSIIIIMMYRYFGQNQTIDQTDTYFAQNTHDCVQYNRIFDEYIGTLIRQETYPATIAQGTYKVRSLSGLLGDFPSQSNLKPINDLVASPGDSFDFRKYSITIEEILGKLVDILISAKVVSTDGDTTTLLDDLNRADIRNNCTYRIVTEHEQLESFTSAPNAVDIPCNESSGVPDILKYLALASGFAWLVL